MRSLAVFGARYADWTPPSSAPAVTVDGVRVRVGLLELPPPPRDPARREGGPAPGRCAPGQVMVRVRAVSCNYRDRGFFYVMQAFPPHRFLTVGSEFAGEVVDVGAGVEGLRPGDRVIPDHAYAGGAGDGPVPEGVATNHGSREYQLLPAPKLARIPAAMDDASAAAFSLGAQTAYSMVRRAGVASGMHVLVTSATAATSLFLIAAARRAGATVHAATGSPRHAAALESLGAASVIPTPHHDPAAADAALAAASAAAGGFDCVLDPFFDVNIRRALRVLRPFGRYITCGLAGQNPGSLRRVAQEPLDAVELLRTAMMRNVTLLGNCLGTADDLRRALHDYEAGLLPVALDSVFSRSSEVARFFERTFNDPDRLGKVVFHYEPGA